MPGEGEEGSSELGGLTVADLGRSEIGMRGDGLSLTKRTVRVREETGQVLVIAVIFMVGLLAIAGFAVDVGHAFLVQRQLQAGVDAAALAGAQELPDTAQAITTAQAYGPTPAVLPATKPNDVTTVDNAVTTVDVKCLTNYGCKGRRAKSNGIEVTATSSVPTWFLGVIGWNSLDVHASSTACSPCSAKGFDVMVVLDRTGSMCDNGSGPCSHSRDLDNAKAGVTQFLMAMDPGLDKVGLAVLPPVLSGTSHCAAPSASRYGYDAWWPYWDPYDRNNNPVTKDSSKYVVAEPDFDFLVDQGNGNWVPNGNKLIFSALACIQANGTTTYANAIAEAKRELKEHGNDTSPSPLGITRGNAQDVIVFFTDGGANTMPKYGWLPNWSVANGLLPYDVEPFGTGGTTPVNRGCRAGIVAANWAKAQQNTLIYTIGFGLAGGNNGAECNEAGMTPELALQQMATDSTTYYGTPEGADLSLVFQQIANDLRDRAGRLIPTPST